MSGTAAAPHDAAAGRRRVARVVLLDPADRILLMHGFEPADPSLNWWFTPGGGVEGAETLEEAARREVAEETGISRLSLGPVLWRRTASFPFDGRAWEQDEWYFLGRTETLDVDTGGHTDLERRSVDGLRWWSCEELLGTRETVYPIRLAGLLRTLLDEGPPLSPILLGTERG
ncbi:NUDIX hydrolase [Actinacidiphila sp. ITFR-21]|uniref:NUDIX hydrolase n=1 Tax=Actinacidiphila sp. ITFR-21 TaxID=3075199 RepID=UPI00288A8370|nr:NUDIX hydrolase [Streptomyces sp. ITFR-21]WNI18302.1 NUDIX hydrolase [Streptomyces sp. ITFR-21]